MRTSSSARTNCRVFSSASPPCEPPMLQLCCLQGIQHRTELCTGNCTIARVEGAAPLADNDAAAAAVSFELLVFRHLVQEAFAHLAGVLLRRLLAVISLQTGYDTSAAVNCIKEWS